MPQALRINLRFEPSANMARRLPVPDHIGEVRGRMVEGRYPNTRIMRGGKKRVTGTQAGADNAQPVIALFLQPIEAAANVHHPLACCVQGSTDVSGDSVISARISDGMRTS